MPLTGNSSNLLRPFQVASSKSRDVSAKAVANQMSLFKWILIVCLLGHMTLFTRFYSQLPLERI